MIEIDNNGKIIKYDKEDLENKEEMIKHVSRCLDNYKPPERISIWTVK